MLKTMLITAAALGTLAAATAPAAAQTVEEQARFAQAQARFQSELARFQDEFDRYRAAQDRDRRNGYYDDRSAPPGYRDNGYYERDENGYDPSRYYRAEPNAPERVLSPQDRVYAGNDGRYYCKRNDGTTGLIIGGAAGGILGNVIDGGHSRIVGTLLGGAAGALAGKSIDQNNQQVVCK
nr:glycine zipper 2TM domain-containing protein [Hephaestia mangrovi]